MAMKLAIGYLVAGRRNPRADGAPARDSQSVARDPMADRPAIPRAVIDWPEGAGDPATDVAGPPCLRATTLRRPHALPIAVLEAAVVAVLFAGVVSAFVYRLGPSLESVLVGDSAKKVSATAPHKVATVTTRVVSLEPVSKPEMVAHRTAP